MNQVILLFAFTVVFTTIIFSLFTSIGSQFELEKNKIPGKPNKTDVSEIHKDIFLEKYGCFSALEEKFFGSVIKDDKYTSGIIIRDNDDIKKFIEKIINEGYDIYGYKLIHKYNNNYDNINIVELGILGKLAGFNYLSVFSYDEKRRGNVYLTYSPPMDRDVPYNADDKTYVTKSDLPNLSLSKDSQGETCGYSCGDSNDFMCGSVGYPNIKSPTRYAVYRIAEKL